MEAHLEAPNQNRVALGRVVLVRASNLTLGPHLLQLQVKSGRGVDREDELPLAVGVGAEDLDREVAAGRRVETEGDLLALKGAVVGLLARSTPPSNGRVNNKREAHHTEGAQGRGTEVVDVIDARNFSKPAELVRRPDPWPRCVQHSAGGNRRLEQGKIRGSEHRAREC